jgi:hypothetical protein
LAALVLSVLLAFPALPSMAQQTVATYFAALGPQDYYNSSGTRLTGFAQVLQQDRANFHRFGNRDAYDEGDPVFADPQVRSMIPALFAAGDNGWWAARPVTPPTWRIVDADILVFICATGGRLSHIIVNHANGDGYNTCEGPVFAGQ